MKTPRLVLIVGCSLLLAGCAGSDAIQQEKLLSEAGFRMHTPTGIEQQRLYAAMPAYKVQRGTYQGRTLYAYKDEARGLAYVGGEPQYNQYKLLAEERRLANEYYQPIEMTGDFPRVYYRSLTQPIFW